MKLNEQFKLSRETLKVVSNINLKNMINDKKPETFDLRSTLLNYKKSNLT